MTEKQNAEMLADIVKDCREAAKIRRQQNFHPLSAREVAGIYERLADSIERATAPSPHPRGEPVAWQTAKVSIDVSTCDADAGRRVFGRVVDWQPEDYDGEKPLGLRLLCEYESDNFGLRAAPPPAWADAVREALKPFAAVAEYDIGETEADVDIYRPMSKNNRAPLLTVGDLRRAAALFPTPQPQEKPTGDQT